MNTPLNAYKELYGSLAKDYNIVISWLEKEHPEVLAQFAQYLEEEE